MNLITIPFIFLYIILGIFSGISGYFISTLSLMYIINALFVNLDLSIIYIVLGILCFLLYFTIPKKYILKLHVLNKNKIPKENYIKYQKRFLILIGLYSLLIGSIWIFTNSTFLAMVKNFMLFDLNMIIFCIVVVFLSFKNKKYNVK